MANKTRNNDRIIRRIRGLLAFNPSLLHVICLLCLVDGKRNELISISGLHLGHINWKDSVGFIYQIYMIQ